MAEQSQTLDGILSKTTLRDLLKNEEEMLEFLGARCGTAVGETPALV